MTPRQITFAGRGSWVSVEYPSVSPFNADCSRLLLQHSGGLMGLYDGDSGNFICETVIRHDQEPRWSRHSPAQLYFIAGNELRLLWDLEKGFSLLIHAFPEYESFFHQGESDISDDGDHIVLAGITPEGATEVFVYSLKDGKGPVFPQERPFDGLKISADNHPILSNPTGIWDLYTNRQLTRANGHAAVTTFEGKPVLLWCSSNDAEIDKNAIMRIDIETGAMFQILDLDWELAFHISAPNVVSVYDPENQEPYRIWKVSLAGGLEDEGEEADLLHEWVSPYNALFQPRASLSRDGSRLVYNVVGHTGDGVCNVWMLDLRKPTVEPISEPGDWNLISYVPFKGNKYRMEFDIDTEGNPSNLQVWEKKP